MKPDIVGPVTPIKPEGPTDAAGRTYAAYGGIYIITALGWLYFIEHRIPNRWDIAGSLCCLAGMTMIMLRPD